MSIFDWWKVLEQEKKKEDLKQKVLEKEDLIDFQKKDIILTILVLILISTWFYFK